MGAPNLAKAYHNKKRSALNRRHTALKNAPNEESKTVIRLRFTLYRLALRKAHGVGRTKKLPAAITATTTATTATTVHTTATTAVTVDTCNDVPVIDRFVEAEYDALCLCDACAPYIYRAKSTRSRRG